MKWIRITINLVVAIVFINGTCALAQDDQINLLEAQEIQQEEKKTQAQQIEEMVVKEKVGAPGYVLSPSQTTIELDKIDFIGPSTSVLDAFKTQAMVDFRGASDLDPGVDSVYLNGFESKRYVTAMDGVTLLKTGGRKSSNIVDWATLPSFLIESVEILPGPHSALYDAKGIGGVINMKTLAPTHWQTRVPELTLTTGYSSYNTFSNTAVIQGGLDNFIYDLAFQNYTTDGYLRNSETDINTGYARLGLLLPEDGFVTLSVSISDIDRNAAVNNPGTTETGATDYDDRYPEVTASAWDPWQEPTWDSNSQTYRLAYAQSLGIGKISASAYYGEDTRDRNYYTWVDSSDESQGTYYYTWQTKWWQHGAKVTDELQWADNQTTTLGVDLAQLYDEGWEDTKTERIRKKGAFAQHRWGIVPSVDITLGARYESVNTWTSNWSGSSYYNTAYGKYVERQFDQIIPKSMTTWKMDGLAPWLRDTSLSAGISKIWRAPDYHGDYNPQGRPAGIFLDPEHGMGYDLIFNRRLWHNVNLKLDYAFYDIKDFIAYNSSYAEYSNSTSGSLSYSDYMINLEEVYRHGISMELGGNLTDKLSFYLTYAWQRFFNQGDEAAGQTELDQRAEHQVGAGLRYELNEKITLMIDYTFQSDETTEVSYEVSDDDWEFYEVDNPAHSVVDLGIKYKCFTRAGWFKDGTLSIYAKNLFDEYYYDTSGYPATGRTVGASFTIKI
jgi:iron complex outermembrane receptor protein